MTTTEEPKRLRSAAADAHARGDLMEALALYERLAQVDPQDPLAPHRAGEILQRLGRTDEAIARLHLAAGIYTRLGFIAKAVSMCKMILDIDPADVEIRYELWALQAGQRGRDKTMPPRAAEPRRPLPPTSKPEPPAGPSPPPLPVEARAPAAPPPATSSRAELPYDRTAHAMRVVTENPDRDWSDVDTTPDDARTTADLISVYEARIGSLSAAPVTRFSAEQLVQLRLNHREGFILSQVDGKMRFEDILDVSGMSRIEALTIILRLLSDGVIGVP